MTKFPSRRFNIAIYSYCLLFLFVLLVPGCNTGEGGNNPPPLTDSSYEETEIISMEDALGLGETASPVSDEESGTTVVIISDLHMGDQRSKDGGYGWLIKNDALLADFLNQLADSSSVDEMVIAGDLFDEWVAPMEYDAFNSYGAGPEGESRFVDSIVEAHPEVIRAIRRVIASGIKVTYVPGNHDMLVTEADIERIFPGINQTRDASGLGAYSPDGLPWVVIEHGHRYDFFNAPDMYSNRIPSSPENITDNPNAIIPPGFFVSKIAASHDIEFPAVPSLNDSSRERSGPFVYWLAWQAILSQIPVEEDHDQRIIKTGIDGYTGVFAINHLVPEIKGFVVQEPLLYQKIEDNWQKRQAQNLVNVPISVASGLLTGSLDFWCDFQSYTQYFLPDPNRRIVVFGHTHHATAGYRINSKLQKCIYANSGTWIDRGDPDRTFVVIKTSHPSNGKTDANVGVYQFTEDHRAKKLHEKTITR